MIFVVSDKERVFDIEVQKRLGCPAVCILEIVNYCLGEGMLIASRWNYTMSATSEASADLIVIDRSADVLEGYRQCKKDERNDLRVANDVT
jgi:hypothetical protein